MRLMAPPGPPLRVAVADDDRGRRAQFRLYMISLTLLTLLATAWFATLGLVPAILALVVAKHILVAILVMGLGIDVPQEVDA